MGTRKQLLKALKWPEDSCFGNCKPLGIAKFHTCSADTFMLSSFKIDGETICLFIQWNKMIYRFIQSGVNYTNHSMLQYIFRYFIAKKKRKKKTKIECTHCMNPCMIQWDRLQYNCTSAGAGAGDGDGDGDGYWSKSKNTLTQQDSYNRTLIWKKLNMTMQKREKSVF